MPHLGETLRKRPIGKRHRKRVTRINKIISEGRKDLAKERGKS